MVSLEFAHAVNMVITPIYWIVLSPDVFKSIKLTSGLAIYYMFFINLLHVIPIVSTTTIIIYSDMLLDKHDWKIVWIPAILYLVPYSMLSWFLKKGYYRFADWNVPWLTVSIFLAMASLQSILHYLFAVWLEKRYKRRPQNRD